MFIGNGERAGSEADTIAQGWKLNNWPEPKIEERFQPDMVDPAGSVTGGRMLNDSHFKENRKIPFGFAMNIGKIFINL